MNAQRAFKVVENKQRSRCRSFVVVSNLVSSCGIQVVVSTDLLLGKGFGWNWKDVGTFQRIQGRSDRSSTCHGQTRLYSEQGE
jgi:hypothetical protein